MNRDDIIRMAREAGLWEADISRPLFDFAALLRDRMLSEGWRQCAQGQKTTQFCGMVEQERDRACRIVTGLCISDNNAAEINRAIRGDK